MSPIFKRIVWAPIAALSLFGAAALSGCGGSSSSSSFGASLRLYNAIPNGGTATVAFTGTPVFSGQAPFNATSYISNANASPTASFTLSSLAGTTFPTASPIFTAGSYYTLSLFGRSDITDSIDPRYPVIVSTLDDRTAPLANQIRVRVVNAAPDLGAIDVKTDNPSATPEVSTVGTNVAYKALSAYSDTAAGTYPISVYLTGTATSIAGPTNYTFVAGNLYSVYVIETSVSPPTYGMQVLNDSAVPPVSPV